MYVVICANSSANVIRSNESFISNTNVNYVLYILMIHHTRSRCDAIYKLPLESALIQSYAYLSTRMNFARCGILVRCAV